VEQAGSQEKGSQGLKKKDCGGKGQLRGSSWGNEGRHVRWVHQQQAEHPQQ